MDYNKIYLLSGKILIALQIIPIIIGLYNYKKLDKPLRVFLAFSIIYLILEVLIQVLIYFVYNYWTYFKPIAEKYHFKDFSFTSILYFMNNFSLLGYFYVLVLRPHKISEWVKWASVCLFFASIVNYLFIEGYVVVGVFNPTMDALFCFILPCIFMWYLFIQDTKVPISKNPYFWINLRFIVPNLIGLILHFVGNKIQSTDSVLFLKISLIKNVLWAIGLVFACLGFYYARYTKYLPQNNP